MGLQITGTAHCATDPVLKYSANGKIKAEVPVYVKDVWTDFSTGETREVSNHFRCVFWGENANRAEKILKKGLQIFILSGKLRNIQHPKNKRITYTQLWVDQWEVPSKVMMTKSLYQEVFKSELLPYKVCLFDSPDGVTVEVHIDKHAMSIKTSDYLKKSLCINLNLIGKNKEAQPSGLTDEHLKFSNSYCAIYTAELTISCHLDEIESVNTEICLNNKIALEHTFLIRECIQQEK